MPKKKREPLDLAALLNGTVHVGEFGHEDFVPLSKIKPRSPEWYWRQRIVKNDLNILAGTQGLGKSQVALDLAAEATRRGEVVLVISAEDSLETTIVPRLYAADAEFKEHGSHDLLFGWTQERPWHLEDAAKLQEYIIKHDASLVIIDPVASFMSGKKDSYRDSDVRSMLMPLRTLAEQHECTILSIMHLKKGMESEAINTVGGSIAWTAAPRSVLIVRRFEDDVSRRVLYHAKCNVGPEQPALMFDIETVDKGVIGNFTSSFVRWGDEDYSLDLAASFPQDGRSSKSSPALEEAVEFLEDALGNGEWSMAAAVKQLAEEAGIAMKTFDRAKKKLKVESENRKGTWYMRLPKKATP